MISAKYSILSIQSPFVIVWFSEDRAVWVKSFMLRRNIIANFPIPHDSTTIKALHTVTSISPDIVEAISAKSSRGHREARVPVSFKCFVSFIPKA